jgi:hypothetical protein
MSDDGTMGAAIREAHYQEHFGPLTEPVMRSRDGKVPTVDVYSFRPNDVRDYWTFITSGMSDVPQSLPEGTPEIFARRTELLMYATESAPWRLFALKLLAEYPFEQGTWIHAWHSVDVGAPLSPESSLSALFLLPPAMEDPQRFDRLEIAGERVNILWVVPITAAEQAFALERGPQALEEILFEADFDQLLDTGRDSLV